MNRRTFLAGAATIALGVAGGPVFGQSFPSQSFPSQSFPSNVVRIIVPFSPSTPGDILARILATALSEGEGWNVIVENKPGAVMSIGANEVLRQPADGA